MSQEGSKRSRNMERLSRVRRLQSVLKHSACFLLSIWAIGGPTSTAWAGSVIEDVRVTAPRVEEAGLKIIGSQIRSSGDAAAELSQTQATMRLDARLMVQNHLYFFARNSKDWRPNS